MPIRFRCVYCNQLLGIAHRKAGTVVRCPTCAGQVVVPTPEAAAAVKDPASPAEPFLFEQNDFDDLFTPGGGPQALPASSEARAETAPSSAPAPAAEVPAGAWGTHAEPPFDVERIEPQAGSPPRGIVLTSTKVWVLGIIWIVTVAAAFGLGLLLGLLLRPSPPQEEGCRPLLETTRSECV